MIDASNMEHFLVEYFGRKIEQNGLGTRLSDLGMDSLSLVEFVMGFEERFGIELNVDRLEPDMALADLAALIIQDSL